MSGNKTTRKEMVRLDLVEMDVFDDIAAGMTVLNVRKKYGCSHRIFYTWIDKVPGRRDDYLFARKSFADHIAEETISIADSSIDPGDAQINKVRIDARRWLASKVAPEQYGEKSAPAISINLQSEHLQALKDINREDSISIGHSDSGD